MELKLKSAMESVLEHILIEQRYGHVSAYTSTICEEFGYVPELDKYVNCFMKALPEKWQSGKWYTVDDRAFQSMDTVFFKNFEVTVRLLRDEEEFKKRVYYHAEDRDFIDREGKLHSPRITMDYITYDSDIGDQLRSDFAHEFTHMYENYKRRLSGKESLQTVADRTKYFDYADISKDKTPSSSVRLLKQFLYWTNEQEQNAHIGTIKAELEPHAEELQNSRKFEDFLNKSETFRDYQIVERYVIKAFVDMKVSELSRERMLDFFKSIFPVEKYGVDSYEKLTRFCLNRWKRWDMKFKKRLSKIVGSLYESKLPKMMDFSFGKIVDFKDFDKFWL